MEHQTLGRWVVCPSDPAYYIEDCRILVLSKSKSMTLIHVGRGKPKLQNARISILYTHSGPKCLPRVRGATSILIFDSYDMKTLWFKFVMISSVASKCQDFKFWMPVFQPFYEMKLKTSNFKVMAFWNQWRSHDQIQITMSS